MKALLSTVCIFFSIFLFVSPILAQNLSQKNTFYNLEEALNQPQEVYKLDLSNKGLTKIPEALCNFENLEVLVLSDNNVKTLPAGFSNLQNLKHLDLSGNPNLNVLDVIKKTSTIKLKQLNLKQNQKEKDKAVPRTKEKIYLKADYSFKS